MFYVFASFATGAKRRERHRGPEGVRARDGESLQSGQEERAENQSQGDCSWGCGGGVW